MKQTLKKTPARILSCCLALIALNATLLAKPRPAAPPMPESHLQLWRFDTAAEFTGTNKGPADVLGVTSSESWSGYSLRVAGEKPARIAFPEINAAGKTNLAFNHGAVRLWFRGDWSSAGLGGKGPSSDARLLSLHSAAKAGVIERALVFDPSGDSLYCADVNGEHLLQAKIGWPAGSWHQVVLNYSTTGTALFLDGEMVAKGEGVAAWPKAAARFFTLGSDANGENLAQGEFEEFTTFARNLTAEEIAWNYRSYAATAQLGPITPEEEAAKKEHQAKLIAARKSGAMQMSLAPPGGGGGGTNGAGGGYSYLTAQTGLRLVDPAWQSNVFTATIAGGEEGGRYDLFFTTNLNVSNAWSFVTRTASGQTNLVVSPADPGFFLLGTMQDADGDTLTDAYEALVSKTDPAGFDSYASTGGTGALAAVLFDVPAAVRLRDYASTSHYYRVTAPCVTQIPAENGSLTLHWNLRNGADYRSDYFVTNCINNSLQTCSEFIHAVWNSFGELMTNETTYSCTILSVTSPFIPLTPWEKCQVTLVSNYTGVVDTLVRQAESQVEFATGGEMFSGTTNLYLLTVRATNRVDGDQSLSLGTNIPSAAIQVPGLTLDTNGQAYIALPDNFIMNVSPVLPAQYSNYVFFVTAELAPKFGGLVISTIAANTNWPGARPAGMMARLGYQAGEIVSDDQIIFDVLMCSPVGSNILTWINVASSIFTHFPSPIDNTRGHLDNGTNSAKIVDREWLTLAMLARSVNEDPPTELDFLGVDGFQGTNSFGWRLMNELFFDAPVANGVLVQALTPANIHRRKAAIGGTKLTFQAGVELRLLSVLPNISISSNVLNLAFRSVAALTENAPGPCNDCLATNAPGSTKLTHETQGHAGTLLHSVEQYIIRTNAPDFTSSLIFTPSGTNMTVYATESYMPAGNWPTANVYKYDFQQRKYIKQFTWEQDVDPFVGFLTLPSIRPDGN